MGRNIRALIGCLAYCQSEWCLHYCSEDLESLNAENEQLKVDMENLKKESRENRRKRDRVEKVLGEAALAIQMVLTVSVLL